MVGDLMLEEMETYIQNVAPELVQAIKKMKAQAVAKSCSLKKDEKQSCPLLALLLEEA